MGEAENARHESVGLENDTNRSLVKCVIVECGKSNAESKPADLTERAFQRI